jgi:TrmH family RNA methyltransferase
MKVICDTVTPQGIAAIASMKPSSLSDIDSLDAKLLICDRIKDPGNMGNIIRASDVFGVKAVIILNGSCNPFAPKVVRATSGSIFNIPIIFADIDELLKWTKAQNIPLIATHPKKGIPIYSAIFGNKFGLIIGEEGQGVDDHLLLLASQIVTIPITGQAESLNVANAAGICLYEVLRQEAMGQTII